MSTMPSFFSRYSRRAVVGSGIAGAVLVPLSVFDSDRAALKAETRIGLNRRDATAELSRWKLWLLASPAELRPPSPGTPTADEIAEVVGYLESPSDEMAAAIAAWGANPATAPWTAAANAAFAEFKVSGMRQARPRPAPHGDA